MSEPSEPSEPTEPPDAPRHDPEGLDLARIVAEGVRRGHDTSPLPPPKQRKPRKTRPDKPRSSDRDPKLLGEAIDDLVTDRGWSTEVTVHAMLGRWPALVGPQNADHSVPEAFRDGVLTIRADSTAWATNLRFIAPQIVAILNDKLGDGTVTRVQIVGPDAPSWKHGRRSVRDGRGPRDTYG